MNTIFRVKLAESRRVSAVKGGVVGQNVRFWPGDKLFFFFQTLDAPSELECIHIWRAGRWSPPAFNQSTHNHHPSTVSSMKNQIFLRAGVMGQILERV